MTSLQDHSGYKYLLEHLLFFFNQNERGTDGLGLDSREADHAIHMPIDEKNRTRGARRISDEPANVGVVSGNPAGDAGVIGLYSPATDCIIGVFKNKSGSSSNATNATKFIAYVVWNHYKIGLSSRMGICMMNLEEPEFGLVADRQWITSLKDREDLINIAIFGRNLVVTLNTGHFVRSSTDGTRA
ncbi:hypothetical protein BG015_006928 [Linnemannia schmuckeri]|uniref:Uncharacterized protein n=1 Tax=Linnemannia schmuckeri TaxID=64567 RepID=A0A9P5VBT2_9FUNG|nr:hypothetical protein BG015_006928 [Linnemannia schmuckeri]